MPTPIEIALLDYDCGTYRDVNFLAPTWDGIEQLIAELEGTFGKRSGYDGEGRSLLEPHWKEVKEVVVQTGYVQLFYSNASGILKKLQIFVAMENDGAAFIELSFFPEDVAQVSNLEENFIEWIGAAMTTLQASQYFCRYENVSWKLGDISSGSGVFLTSAKHQ